MKKLGVFMADGCEEIEALTVVDLARRAGIEVAMISITGDKLVKGAHGIDFHTDIPAEYMDFDMLDGIVLPGGMPGTLNLGANDYVQKIIAQFASEGKLVAAICAAPTVFANLGLLKGKTSTCNPGFWEELRKCDANVIEDSKVVVNGNIITSQAMGTSVDFGLALVGYLCGEDAKEELRKNIRFGAL